MGYTLKVCGLTRQLPFVPLSENEAYASFVMISDTELISKAAQEMAEEAERAGTQAVLTIEAKGIALSYEISKILGMQKFVVVRKSRKSYMKDCIKDSVHSITTTGEQQLFLDAEDAAFLKGKMVALVDDVISKGDSMKAAERIVKAAGGTVCAKLAVLAEGKAAGRTDIFYLQKLPLFHKENGIWRETE